jgi:Zn-dependent peptidase ImmA (M78 family)/transcriptional regulator with XRE-family HTH domain
MQPRLLEAEDRVNPEMVILGREVRGLTQLELAQRLRVSQGKVSKVEAGLLGMSVEEVARLSVVLDLPAPFFYQREQRFGPGLGELFHRRRQDVPVRVLSRLHGEINWRRIHAARLLRAVEIDCRVPQLDLDDFAGNPAQAARAVRASWMLPRGPIPNLAKAIEDAGGLIIAFDFGTRQVDAISQRVPGLPPLFFVNTSVPQDRCRFTLAHELAHMILHRSASATIEDEANEFAAEFLMPERDIRADLSGVSIPKLAALKPFWRVSMAALLNRAMQLGKVTARQYRTLWTKMGQAGYRKQEPVELEVHGEVPSLLQELLDIYLKQLGYSLDEMANLLLLFGHELLQMYFPRHTGLRLLAGSE